MKYGTSGPLALCLAVTLASRAICYRQFSLGSACVVIGGCDVNACTPVVTFTSEEVFTTGGGFETGRAMQTPPLERLCHQGYSAPDENEFCNVYTECEITVSSREVMGANCEKGPPE
ncbi:MAG: hypothetical protein ACF8Q5_05400 [Phycisphaerales bacterium JB040]